MDKQLAQMESVLGRLMDQHQRLLKLLERKRLAVRAAEHGAVADMCEQENRCVQQIGELEKNRLGLLAELTLLVDPKAGQPFSLRELAERLDEPARGRLLVLRQTLREKMLEVQKQTKVLRRSAESLVAHMQGLVQTVGGMMTGVTVYNTNGRLPQSSMAISTFNMTA